MASESEETTSTSSEMEEGQVRRQSVSACDTSLITFQVEVGSEMFATPSSLVKDTPLPVPPPSGSVEPPSYDVGPVQRSRRVQGQEPYFHVGITRGARWIPPSNVSTWVRPTRTSGRLSLHYSSGLVDCASLVQAALDQCGGGERNGEPGIMGADVPGHGALSEEGLVGGGSVEEGASGLSTFGGQHHSGRVFVCVGDDAGQR